MDAAQGPEHHQDEAGIHRVGIGAALGLAGALLAIVVPVALLLVATYAPVGFLALDQSAFVEATSILILAGAILFLVSLFFYRNAFAHLRKVDRRFIVASILCLVGSLGFILLLVAAVVVLGSASSLLSCVGSQPSHALSCLRSGEPLGAYTGLTGFWLGWLGGVGLVIGLSAGSSRFHDREVGLGAALYAVLLLALIGPFVALIVSYPGVEFLLLLAPILSVLAPAFVFRGAGAAARRPAPPTSAN